jgi:hypothetical protein
MFGAGAETTATTIRWTVLYLIHNVDIQNKMWKEIDHYSHKVDFTQEYLKKNEKKLAQSFNFTFHCIDDVFLLNNSVLRHSQQNFSFIVAVSTRAF